ncbi:hypothetical protein Mapa_017729 [Marchantia paleacea]|nr:hypothetical protein Mapa_017729 [Marchantia paleacea]
MLFPLVSCNQRIHGPPWKRVDSRLGCRYTTIEINPSKPFPSSAGIRVLPKFDGLLPRRRTQMIRQSFSHVQLMTSGWLSKNVCLMQ